MQNIIREPLTLEEAKSRIEEDSTYITGIVPVELSFIIDGDLEVFLDELSEKLLGRSTLMDINYKCVGAESDGLTLLMEVSGDISELLDDEDLDNEE